MTRAPLVAVVLLWPLVASAATIDFAHPTIAATRFCSAGPTPIGFGFLDLVEHQGLRVDFSNEMGAQNRYACDNDAPVFPTDWPSPTTPFRELVLPDGELRLMTIWAADNGFFQVSNIGGGSILGFTFHARAFSNGPGIPCTASLLVDNVAFDTCDGLDQFFAFAAPVQTFRVRLRWEGRDPSLQLVSVRVPEPSTLALVGLGLVAVARRRT